MAFNTLSLLCMAFAALALVAGWSAVRMMGIQRRWMDQVMETLDKHADALKFLLSWAGQTPKKKKTP